MSELPEPRGSDPRRGPRGRTIHIRIEPQGWLGKGLALLAGALLLLFAFFFSLLLFGVAVSAMLGAYLYALWQRRRPGGPGTGR